MPLKNLLGAIWRRRPHEVEEAMTLPSIGSTEFVGQATMAFGEPYAGNEEIAAAEAALQDLAADHEELSTLSSDLKHAIAWRILVAAATARRKQSTTAMTLDEIKRGL